MTKQEILKQIEEVFLKIPNEIDFSGAAITIKASLNGKEHSLIGATIALQNYEYLGMLLVQQKEIERRILGESMIANQREELEKTLAIIEKKLLNLEEH